MSNFRFLKPLVNLALVATCGLTMTPAFGHVIPGGSSSSDDLVLNFDLTSHSTSFDSFILDYSFSSPNASGGDGSGSLNLVPVTVDIFGGLDGSGLLTTFTVNINGVGTVPDTSSQSLAGMRDGAFSVGLRVSPGEQADGTVFVIGKYTIDQGGDGGGQGDIRVTLDPVAGVLSTQTPNSVPEPAPVALLWLGLAGLAAVRRSRQ